jgi:hypothetical protein
MMTDDAAANGASDRMMPSVMASDAADDGAGKAAGGRSRRGNSDGGDA